jgi:anti-sigma factor RsiW
MSQESHGTERLSEYLDGGLDAAERAAVERHLDRCVECAGIVAELRAVVTEAAVLPEVPPARDLWPGIRARLAPRAPGRSLSTGERTPGASVISLWSRRRLTITVPQLVAAGLAVAVLSAGGVWAALSGTRAPGGPATSLAAAPATGPAVALLAAYEPAMSDLETEYERRRGELDLETIQVVERNLAIIDAAIREASHALAADPASGFLHTRLADAMRMRMGLLRQASSI